MFLIDMMDKTEIAGVGIIQPRDVFEFLRKKEESFTQKFISKSQMSVCRAKTSLGTKAIKICENFIRLS
jgi:hypothetical protein